MMIPLAPNVSQADERGALALIDLVRDLTKHEARIFELQKIRDDAQQARNAADEAVRQQMTGAAELAERERLLEEAKATLKTNTDNFEKTRTAFNAEKTETQRRLKAAETEIGIKQKALADEIAAFGEQRAEEQSTIEAQKADLAKQLEGLQADRAKLNADIAEAAKIHRAAENLKAEYEGKLAKLKAVVS